ncbi:MAG: hypothetical protein J6B85_05145 [Lachnospiraceae bacterium]|nr:hypothetical protein [Lachnospiraceae bacterium]
MKRYEIEANENSEKNSMLKTIVKVAAAVAVIRGVSVLVKKILNEKSASREEETKDTDCPEHYAIFGGRKFTCEGETYQGGEYTAVMGGIELDLSKAVIEKDISVTCKTVMGGIDLKVPNDINVSVSGTVVFGGMANMVPENRPGATIYLHAEGLMGGICVRAAGVEEEKNAPEYGGADVLEEEFEESERA